MIYMYMAAPTSKSLLLTLISVEVMVIFCVLISRLKNNIVLSSASQVNKNKHVKPVTNSSESQVNITKILNPSEDSVAEEFLQNYTTYCRQTFTIRLLPGLLFTKPPCPCVPDNLIGRYNVSFNVPTVGEMELTHKELLPGGVWEPLDCVARQRIVIIVPFRDREEHLRIFLYYMHSILQKQQLAYRIIVVEQAKPDIFNKAMMMNIGFVEAKTLDNYDCFFFHDVDMIPEDDRNIYTCSETPRHVGAYCKKFNYKLRYPRMFGGATAFKKSHFELSNGFSNEFYGWGGEDDDMLKRAETKKLKIVRYPRAVSRYTMIEHKRDKRNPFNSKSGVAWSFRPKVYKKDGLNTLKYQRLALQFRPLYTWIQAAVADPVRAHNSSSRKV